MLDVLAPHESLHTRKDFLIHIATIVIGLLMLAHAAGANLRLPQRMN
jgi:hypothetical protein